MAKAIFVTILTILAVIGLADLIRLLSAWILSGSGRQYIVSVIPCKGNEEEIEYIVKSAYSRLKEQYRCKECRIIIADSGIDPKTRKICEQLCHDIDGVILCEGHDVRNILQEKFHLQIDS